MGEPLLCVDGLDMFFRPGMPTVEQCVQLLLADDEICLGMTDKRRIMQGARLVGYVRIVAECAWDSAAATHRGADGS